METPRVFNPNTVYFSSTRFQSIIYTRAIISVHVSGTIDIKKLRIILLSQSKFRIYEIAEWTGLESFERIKRAAVNRNTVDGDPIFF